MPEKATMDKDRSERADALIARMKQARGYIYPEWEFAARQDPEFVEAYVALARVAGRLAVEDGRLSERDHERLEEVLGEWK